ncbi:MAG: STAS/SEC14 domain-containing protein [Nitritalea sp.]
MEAYATFTPLMQGIVLIRFTGAAGTKENFENYLQETLALYAEKQPLCLLFDASQASIPGTALQKMQADWLKTHEDLMQRYCRGTAYVIRNTLVRTVLKAIFALQRQPVPYALFKTNEEALTWCEQRMGADSSETMTPS